MVLYLCRTTFYDKILIKLDQIGNDLLNMTKGE